MARTDVHVPFPDSRHLPLGRPFGLVDERAEPASAARPFGMRLARRCSAASPLDPSRYGYDPNTQTGTVHEGDTVVPLARHTDGPTNSVTDRGDGRGTNKDTDDDWRED